jgi:hypothetical protein
MIDTSVSFIAYEVLYAVLFSQGREASRDFEVWAQRDESSKEIQEATGGLSTYKFDGYLTPLRVYVQLREDSATIWPICVGVLQNAFTSERTSPPSDEHLARTIL